MTRQARAASNGADAKYWRPGAAASAATLTRSCARCPGTPSVAWTCATARVTGGRA
jgi:hypothetical protein